MSLGNWLFIPTAALETHPTLTLPDGNSVNFDKYVLRESIFYSEDKDGMQRRTRQEDMEPSKPTPKKTKSPQKILWTTESYFCEEVPQINAEVDENRDLCQVGSAASGQREHQTLIVCIHRGHRKSASGIQISPVSSPHVHASCHTSF